MAKITLPTNYKDDILNSSAEGKRKYVMSYNQDGTVSFEDVTPYEQVGSDFGAGDINTANEAINESFDKNKLVKDLDTINALTEEGYAPDALVVKQLSESLVASDNLKFQFATDGEGNYGYLGADDSFIPFKTALNPKEMYFCHYATTNTSGLYYNGEKASNLGTAEKVDGVYLSMKRSARTYTFTCLQDCEFVFYNTTNNPYTAGEKVTMTAGETFTVYDAGSNWCFAIIVI